MYFNNPSYLVWTLIKFLFHYLPQLQCCCFGETANIYVLKQWHISLFGISSFVFLWTLAELPSDNTAKSFLQKCWSPLRHNTLRLEPDRCWSACVLDSRCVGVCTLVQNCPSPERVNHSFASKRQSIYQKSAFYYFGYWSEHCHFP